MTDKELLELAAKAAGYKTISDRNSVWIVDEHGDPERRYNPLNDDGDALRLATNLFMTIKFEACAAVATVMPEVFAKERSIDPAKAVRLAIVRAAAEYQLRLKKGNVS